MNTSDHLQTRHWDRPALAKSAAAVVAGCVLFLILVADLPVLIHISLLGLAGMVIARRASVGVYVILALVLGYNVISQWAYSAPNDSLMANDILMAIALVVFASYAFRYLELHPQRFRWKGGLGTESDSDEQAGAAKELLRPLYSSLLRIPIALTLAAILLGILPLRSLWPNEFGMLPVVYRMVIVGWVVGIATVLLSSTFSWLGWRKLRPLQAGIYVNRVLASELGREQRAIERRRARHQQSNHEGN